MMARFGSHCLYGLDDDNWDDCVHQVGAGDGPLEGLIAAIGGAGDGDEMFDPEPVEERLFRRHDVAHRDRREIGSIGLVGVGVMLAPLVDPKDDPSMFDDTTKSFSVSIALPGPSSRSRPG
jgi:hypothetical protein